MLQWIKQSKDNWNKEKRHINSKIIKLLRFLWFFDFLTFWFYVLPQWKTDQDNRMLGHMFMILFPVVGIVLKRAKTTEMKRKNNKIIRLYWFFDFLIFSYFQENELQPFAYIMWKNKQHFFYPISFWDPTFLYPNIFLFSYWSLLELNLDLVFKWSAWIFYLTIAEFLFFALFFNKGEGGVGGVHSQFPNP